MIIKTTMKKEIIKVADEAQLAALAEMMPKEASAPKLRLPRFGMVSQDVTEETGTGKNKKIEVIAAEGTFFTDRETEEVEIRDDGTEKKVWKKEYFEEDTAEGIIIAARKQLRFYDNTTNMFTASPIYDKDDEIIPLFCNREEVARGTAKELKALYPGTTLKGKPTSLLKDEKILYVLRGDELFQMNVRGTSLWSFQAYARKVAPPTVVTVFGSEHMENGSTKWSKTIFTVKRRVTGEEASKIMETISDLKSIIAAEKAAYAGEDSDSASAPAVRYSAVEEEKDGIF